MHQEIYKCTKIIQHNDNHLEVSSMGKKGSTPMTLEAARRIQSAVDSGRAIKADESFKSRAMSAAARNSKGGKK
jgi:hypothetical protein